MEFYSLIFIPPVYRLLGLKRCCHAQKIIILRFSAKKNKDNPDENKS
ncbi:hypothetical protein DR66_5248 [Delftia acidovorans]|nr:hypothetical protein DR66_5248 [Delftia acidovorans]